MVARIPCCRLAYGVFLALAAAAPGPAVAVGLDVQAGRTQIYLGESFLLNVPVSGADADAPAPDVSALAADVKALGSQSNSRHSFRLVNGRVSREDFEGRVFVYEVRPRAAGTFATGPVTLRAGGRTLTARGPDVRVQGIERQDLVAARLVASRDAVLVDEPFTIALEVTVASLPEPHARIEPILPANPPHLESAHLSLAEIAGLQVPDLQPALQALVARNPRAPAFTINSYASRAPDIFSDPFNFGFDVDPLRPRPTRFRLEPRDDTIGGRPARLYSLSLAYTPRQEGDYTFGPLTFKGPVATAVSGDGQAVVREVFTVGPAVTVRVVPPPEAGRPEWFLGSVGSNAAVRAALDTSICKVGDPLLLALDVTGNLSLGNMRPPQLNLQPELTADFRIYDENVETTAIPGGKRFRYRIRPLREGTLELPPIKVAWFDTASRAYRTATSDPLPVQARPNTQIVSNPGEAGSNRAAVLHLRIERAADLPSAITVAAAGSRPAPLLPGRPLALPLAAAGPLLVLAAWTGRALWRRRASLAAAWRRRRALPCARDALRRPGTDAAAVGRALRAYLGARHGVAGAALTADEAAALVQRHAPPGDAAEDCRELLRRVDAAQYRPDAAPDEAAALARDALALLARLEQTRGAARTGDTRALGVLLALLVLPLAARAAAGTPADAARAFLWEEANATLAAARTPDEYLRAARAYNRLVLDGVRNGPLFFNLGTALLLAGDAPNAVAALERAERYDGGTPDIRANLRLALAARSGQSDSELPWSRMAFFWHFDQPARARAAEALAGWCLLWLGLLLRLLSRRRRARSLGGSCTAFGAVLAVVFGASALLTYVQEAADSRAWPARVFVSRSQPEHRP